jgi:hypothetical protein
MPEAPRSFRFMDSSMVAKHVELAMDYRFPGIIATSLGRFRIPLIVLNGSL